MSLGDWNSYRDGGSLSSDAKGTIFTDVLSPMFGTGSVALSHTATTDFQSINLTPATSPTGFLSGRMQTLIRLDSFDDGGTPNTQENHVGLLCLQGGENMAQFGAFGGIGQCYGCSFSIGEGFSTQNVRLWKFTAGLDGSTGNLNPGQVLDSVPSPFPLTQSDIVAIEIVWSADPIVITDLGGVLLTVRVGQNSDFSDLQDVINYVDTITPYTVTVAESVWAGFKNAVSGFENRVTFDETSLFRTIIT